MTPYWRSLEELAQTEEFRAFVEDEFPNRTPDWNDPASRRRFLTLMGASIALAGASACTMQPKETIVPYVRQPEEIVPGKPLFYATSMSMGGIAHGAAGREPPGTADQDRGQSAIIRRASVRPTRFMQASVLTLYDPDRSQTVTRNGYISTWGEFSVAR